MLAMWRPPGIDVTLDEQPLLLDAGQDRTGIDPEHPVRLLGYYNASRRRGQAKAWCWSCTAGKGAAIPTTT